VREALVWNTCHRFELYGWLDGEESDGGCTVAQIRREMLRGLDTDEVNVLFGASAWHHLMRTIIGLNSGLPGDKDIVEQFLSAHQTAERCGTAGPRLRALVEEVMHLTEQAGQQTTWGRNTVGYCYAALDRITRVLDRRLANCRHVVIGGSATSRAVLRTLFEHFEVRENDATLVYRAHQGGRTKQLRSAIGNGRRIRTDSYASREVLHAITEADVVYYGIDRDEPVLSGDDLRGMRDFLARPLVIIDFNTLGSTRNASGIPGVTLWTAERIDAEVEAFGEELAQGQRFPDWVQEAETWVQSQSQPDHCAAPGLPCVRTGQTVNPQCATCGRDLGELMERRTADAVRA
jgi:glutamyl-tRNA reductase